jgi:hypothetical protein
VAWLQARKEVLQSGADQHLASLRAQSACIEQQARAAVRR